MEEGSDIAAETVREDIAIGKARELVVVEQLG